MIPSDPSSLLFLLIGKDSNWMPIIMLIMVIIQQWCVIQSSYKKVTLYGKTQYIIKGKVYVNKSDAYTYGDISNQMWGLFVVINDTLKKHCNLSKVATLDLPTNSVFNNNESILIPSQNEYVTLNNDIKCYVDYKVNQYKTERDPDRGTQANSIDDITINITLITTKSMDYINKYLSSITTNYNTIKDTKRYDKLHIIKPLFRKPDPYSISASDMDFPRLIPFKSSKTFDNMFFDGKDELLHRLSTFKNRTKYASLGLPETLGLLFYGEPGCGKTSVIKAIANYMNMNIVAVPMNLIKTKKRLEDIFFSDRIDFPQEKRIYVFEEIDCNGWENIVRDRRFAQKELKETTENTTALDLIADKLQGGTGVTSFKKKDDSDDKLTLGAILEVIDGIVEAPGRIIIMTTNHKEFLDPALLRPGRIDMEIEFKKLRRHHICQIFEKWYNTTLYSNQMNDIPDYKFTQAEISQLLFKHEYRPYDFIKELSKHSN